jgi:hypothetical protein
MKSMELRPYVLSMPGRGGSWPLFMGENSRISGRKAERSTHVQRLAVDEGGVWRCAN